jgi:hypothetical protein
LNPQAFKPTVPLFRPADLILILLLGATSFFIFRLGREPRAGRSIRVSVDGIPRFSKDLSVDTVFSVRGSVGDTEIEIRSGTARILRSPCPRKICRHQGSVSAAGEMLICIPNRVTVAVEGRDPDGSGVDALTQ